MIGNVNGALNAEPAAWGAVATLLEVLRTPKEMVYELQALAAKAKQAQEDAEVRIAQSEAKVASAAATEAKAAETEKGVAKLQAKLAEAKSLHDEAVAKLVAEKEKIDAAWAVAREEGRRLAGVREELESAAVNLRGQAADVADREKKLAEREAQLAALLKG